MPHKHGSGNGITTSSLFRGGAGAGSLTVAAERKLHTSQPSLSRQGFISNEAGRVKDVFVLFFTYLSLRFSSLGTPVRLRGRAVLLDG